MPRTPQPRHRADRDHWYGQIDRQRIVLAHGKGSKQKAKEELIRLLADAQSRPAHRPEDWLVGELCERRLDWLLEHTKPSTWKGDQWYLNEFTKALGRLRVSALRVHHVTDWLRSKPRWGSMTRRRAVVVIKAVFSWARRQGLIAASPIDALERPPATTRPTCAGKDTLAQILPWVRSNEFRDYLTVLAECGCRPSELSRLAAADLDVEMRAAVLRDHKTAHKTRKARVIHFHRDRLGNRPEARPGPSRRPSVPDTRGTGMGRLRPRPANESDPGARPEIGGDAARLRHLRLPSWLYHRRPGARRDVIRDGGARGELGSNDRHRLRPFAQASTRDARGVGSGSA